MIGAEGRLSLPAREAQALAEIEATRIDRPTAVVLVVTALLCLMLGPVVEWIEPGSGLASPATAAPPEPPALARLAALLHGHEPGAANALVKRFLDDTESFVDRDGALARLLRSPAQRPLATRLRYGNGEVIVGRDGWLFFQRAFAHTVGGPFLGPIVPDRPRMAAGAGRTDPVRGLLELALALEARGTRLVIVPVPEKEQIYPARLAGGTWGAPATHPALPELASRLAAAGIVVFDPAPALFRAARSAPDLYLPTDTHWTPRGMDLVAAELARHLRRELGALPGPPTRFEREEVRLTLPGDLARLLGFPAAADPFAREETLGYRVLATDGRPFLAERSRAPILVLGDSFDFIYAVHPEIRGAGGFAELLAFHLEREVMARRAPAHAYDLGARTACLVHEPELLGEARLVVFEFAARALSIGDWTPPALAPRPGSRQS